MEPEKLSRLLWITGIPVGVLCWICIRASSFIDESFITWIVVAVFAIVMLGSNKIARDTGLNLSKFRIAMAIGLAACILIFVITLAITSAQAGTPFLGKDSKGTGLIEVIFGI